MAKAGFCSQCQANVWLREDGSCENGHSPEAISNAFESDPGVPTSRQDPHGATAGKRIHPAVIVGIVAVLLAVIAGSCWSLAMLAEPLANKGTAVTSEWQARVGKDYPGWKIVGLNVMTLPGQDGSETDYTIAVQPPGSDFPVGIVYAEKNGDAPVLQDEVLRPAGKLHGWSSQLLVYLKRNYAAQGKDIASVTSDSEGSVVVEWVKVNGIGPFTWRTGSVDGLYYDEDANAWLDSSK